MWGSRDIGGTRLFRGAEEFVANVDARRGLVHFVFDFGFGEGGAVVDAPVDRLEAFVNKVLLEEFVEGFDDTSIRSWLGHR